MMACHWISFSIGMYRFWYGMLSWDCIAKVYTHMAAESKELFLVRYRQNLATLYAQERLLHPAPHYCHWHIHVCMIEKYPQIILVD